MQITKELKENTNIVILSGEVDLSNSPVVRKMFQEIITNKTPNIIVDLSNVSYMDSSGLATLIEAMQKCAKNTGKLKLFGITGAVKSMFEIARMDTVFSISQTLEDALKDFSL